MNDKQAPLTDAEKRFQQLCEEAPGMLANGKKGLIFDEAALCELSDMLSRTTPPAEPNALQMSIAELDALLDTDCCEVLTPSQSESIGLVLHELKRLRATEVAQASAEPVAILFPNSDSPFGYSMMAKDSHPHVIWLVDGFNVYTAPAASAVPVSLNSAVEVDFVKKSAIDSIIREVAELPDRNSPEGWPEAMLVTADELNDILEDSLVPVSSAAPVVPSAELTWLYTHCRAIGMTRKSDSGRWEHDIAQFTTDLQDEIRALKASTTPGVEAAAKWVDQRRFDYESEHGSIDPDTGAPEFGAGKHAQIKDEYAAELAEIAEGIRAIAAAPKEPTK